MKRSSKIVRAIVFDFDGTIADTFSRAVEVVNLLSVQHGFRSIRDEDLAHVRTLTARQFGRFLGLRRRQIPRLLIEGKQIMGQGIDQLDMIDGMTETVRRLREKTPLLGILTSNTRPNVERFLAAHDLRCFDFIDTVPRLSGKSRRLKAIMRSYKLVPAQLAYIGDEVRDMKAARRSGAAALAVTWGFNAEGILRRGDPHGVANDAEELLKLLQDRMESVEVS